MSWRLDLCVRRVIFGMMTANNVAVSASSAKGQHRSPFRKFRLPVVLVVLVLFGMMFVYKFTSQFSVSTTTFYIPMPRSKDTLATQASAVGDGGNASRKRVLFQLRNVPKRAKLESQKPHPLVKSVVLWDDRMDELTPEGQTRFKELKCAVDLCSFTRNRSQETLMAADAILFRHEFTRPTHNRPPGQIWIVHLLESPWNSPNLNMMNGAVNWTATYRLDSTIPTPYAIYFPFAMTGKARKNENSKRNFARGKTKKVAWVVSNCHANNDRLEYAKELGNYIPVDIYGKCGTKGCRVGNSSDTDCFKMIKQDYKFYLSFENSNCRGYITEKFFGNALRNDVLPIVKGAHPDDYMMSAPPNSYLHVDNFTSPEELGEYLKILDQDDELYNSFFKWRDEGEMDYVWHYYCRFCAMLWDNVNRTRYADLNSWWRTDGTCTKSNTWKKP